MARYIKTAQVEAHPFVNGGADMPLEFQRAVCRCALTAAIAGPNHIHTLEGPHGVLEGDWLIRGVKGEYYPCKPDIFAMSYSLAPVQA